jgi:hypothetical protein
LRLPRTELVVRVIMVPSLTLPTTFKEDAMDAVCLDNLDPLDHQDCQESLVNQERQACLVCPEHHQLHHASLLLHHHASHAHKVHPAHLVLLDHQETLASQEPPVAQDPMLLQDPPDQKDHLDPLENLDQMDQLEMLVFPLRANLFNPVILAQLETQVHKDHQGHLVSLVEMDNQVPPDQKDQRDQRDHLEPMVFPDLKDPLGLLVPKENVVFARNTAPWMVEFSSKMVQGDRHELFHRFYYAHKIFPFGAILWFIQRTNFNA